MNVSNNRSKNCPKRLFQYLATVTSSLNVFSSGMHYGWTSSALPILLEKHSPIPTTDNEGSWIAVMILIGAVCGSALAGVILDRLGRKNVILLTAALFFISWIMLAFAKSVPVIMAARFVAGIPDGLTYCTIPMYVAEIADYKVRGLLTSSFVVIATGGILVTNVIGSYLALETTAWISSIFPIFVILTFVWMPESPYYLIMKGQMDKAKKSLSIFRGGEDVDEELSRMQKSVEEESTNTGKYLDLFTVRSNRRALYIILGVRAFTELSGTTALLFYAQIVFEQASNDMSPVVASSIFFGVKIIASAISSLLVDRTGRIPLAIASLVGCSIALFVEGAYFYIKMQTSIDISNFSIVSIVALIGFVVAINIGLQTVAIILIGEIFPTNVKAFAFSFNDICYCLFCLIASKFFQFTKDAFGMYVPFFVFACCCVLGIPFIVLCVPETRGKTLEQIQDELKNYKRPPSFHDIGIMVEKLSLAGNDTFETKGVTLDQFIEAEIDRRRKLSSFHDVALMSEEIPLVSSSGFETKRMTLDEITQVEFDRKKESPSLHDVAIMTEGIPLQRNSGPETKGMAVDKIIQVELDIKKKSPSLHNVTTMSEEVPLIRSNVLERKGKTLDQIIQVNLGRKEGSPSLHDVGVMVEKIALESNSSISEIETIRLEHVQDELEMKKGPPSLYDIGEMVEKISLKSNKSITETLEQIKDELTRKRKPPGLHNIVENIMAVRQ